jgi:DNA polymerase (family X)
VSKRADERAMNDEIANRLEEIATILAAQRANRFRIRAYRQAARTVRQLRDPVASLLDSEGLAGLDRLPGIGPTLARAIRDIVRLGYSPMLARLRGDADPLRLLATVPGIGPRLAVRLHEELGVETLEDLEAAAHDGRLDRLPGFGEKRIAGIRAATGSRLAYVRRPPPDTGAPPVAELLDIDREYREGVALQRLPKIAPRRFNPNHLAWLPILHTSRSRRHFTALFSNTARAHQLQKNEDWVVIYCDHDGADGQWTVVTSQMGPLRGRRLVRGREPECARHYGVAAA